jgi:hypothetical protein
VDGRRWHGHCGPPAAHRELQSKCPRQSSLRQHVARFTRAMLARAEGAHATDSSERPAAVRA